jgi:hypothetical protein
VNSPFEKPTDDQVREALDRILDTREFKKAPQMTKFLRYVVEQDLAGNRDEIKEYSVATKALGKPEDYDPDTSAAVRGLAGRVRKYLLEYYKTAGAADSVRIDIPTGSFKPNLTMNVGKGQRSLEALAEFFGMKSAATKDSGAAGVIVVQSDPIDEFVFKLIEDVAPQLKGKITISPDSRLFKAREWVNRWDYDGGRAIRSGVFAPFQKQGVVSPDIVPRDHRPNKPIDPAAPYLISMGLGYTDWTERIVQVCRAWMNNERAEGTWGDALWLHEKLMPEVEPENPRFLPAENGFRPAVPSDWDEKTKGAAWMKTWVNMRNKEEGSQVNDYAIILRHTEAKPSGARQVWFALAGFSERGTAIAGFYLADRWDELWRKYLHEEPAESLGDFLVVIAGPSKPDPEWKVDDWSEVLAVTPRKVAAAEIPCVWKTRMERPQSHHS